MNYQAIDNCVSYNNENISQIANNPTISQSLVEMNACLSQIESTLACICRTLTGNDHLSEPQNEPKCMVDDLKQLMYQSGRINELTKIIAATLGC